MKEAEDKDADTPGHMKLSKPICIAICVMCLVVVGLVANMLLRSKNDSIESSTQPSDESLTDDRATKEHDSKTPTHENTAGGREEGHFERLMNGEYPREVVGPDSWKGKPYVLTKGRSWRNRNEVGKNFKLLLLFRDKKLENIGDLRPSDVKMLKDAKKDVLEVVGEHFGLEEKDLKMWFNYPGDVKRLHMHVALLSHRQHPTYPLDGVIHSLETTGKALSTN